MTLLQKKLFKIVLWNVLLTAIISVVLWACGVEVFKIIGGLGVGGLMLAFLVKDLIASVAAAFIIATYKLYNIGDYVTINGKEGFVHDISLSFTILVDNELAFIKVPNSEAMSKGVKVSSPVSE